MAAVGAARVRLECQATPHALSWLGVFPSKARRTMLASTPFRCLLRWTLGLEIVGAHPDPAKMDLQCPACDTLMDSTGHHLVCCHKLNLTRRHGAVQDVLVTLSRDAGLVCRKEVRAEDNSRPGDIFYPRFTVDGPGAVDVTVRNPMVGGIPLDLTEWHERQEDEKCRKYSAACRRRGWEFVPFVMDVYGGSGPAARTVMSKIVELGKGQVESWAQRTREATVWQTLTLALMREVGRQLAHAVHAQRVGDDQRETQPVVGSSWHTPYMDC